ncbi:hypothetical protein [Spirillospora albida]|uniref:hypothetical protein n=1 Tax=Spirillospora albida TaxID=58123 RepID=UPI000A05A49C|nr:hypothetical protein [Spirillospora albida]
MADKEEPRPFHDRCACFDQRGDRQPERVGFHGELQDTAAPGWVRLLRLIDEADADGREEFAPLRDMSAEHRRQIVTLPPTIARLTRVKHLLLYGSDLVRIPPEIGDMASLEEFTPYTSYRLHWFPYELTRCANLRQSTVSTRALYGNFKTRPPFPELKQNRKGFTYSELDPGEWGATSIRTCSVCAGPIPATGPHQVWISKGVATDVLPLLVNACSESCVEALPEPAGGHVPTVHRGGPDAPRPEAGL